MLTGLAILGMWMATTIAGSTPQIANLVMLFSFVGLTVIAAMAISAIGWGSIKHASLPSSLLFTHSVLTSMSAKTTEMSLEQQTTALAKEVSLKLSAPASFTIDELEAISTFFSQQIEAL